MRAAAARRPRFPNSVSGTPDRSTGIEPTMLIVMPLPRARSHSIDRPARTRFRVRTRHSTRLAAVSLRAETAHGASDRFHLMRGPRTGDRLGDGGQVGRCRRRTSATPRTRSLAQPRQPPLRRIRAIDHRPQQDLIEIRSGAGSRWATPFANDARQRPPGPTSATLVLFRGGLGERLLERAFAAGFAGHRQLRGPSGDPAGQRCGALAAGDLDWRTLTELGEQASAVLLR